MLKKGIVLTLLIVALCFGIRDHERISGPLVGKTILFIVSAENFRDEELLLPRNALVDAGASIEIASTTLDDVVGMLGATLMPDLLIDDINVNNYDGIIFVGGTGARSLWDNTTLHKIANDFKTQNKVIGAICLAPVIIARAGLLKDTPATVFSSVKDEIKKHGAKYIDQSVVIHGKIITANGPEAAEDFGKNLVGMFIAPPKTQANPQ